MAHIQLSNIVRIKIYAPLFATTQVPGVVADNGNSPVFSQLLFEQENKKLQG